MATGNPPLGNVRVIDLGRYQAGPRCGLVLARLGAEVIKVEKPEGDESRDHGPFVRGQSAYWVQYNSGKKSLSLNLRDERGKAVLRELVKVSDILIQNFRPGTMDAMGLGYNALRSLNLRIIMVNISAYGHDGPYSDRIGFDALGQASSGHMLLTGSEGMPPIKTYSPVVDRITSLHGTVGALAALWEREHSGEGQCMDISLVDSGYSMMEIPISAYLGSGYVTPRTGNRYGAPPNDTYRCRDGWVMLLGTSTNLFSLTCGVIGKPEWADDPRFATWEGRLEHVGIIDEAVSQWVATRTVAEAVDAFNVAGVPACPVNDLPTAARDPHPWARNLLVEVPDPTAGSIHVAGDYMHFSRSQAAIGPAPTPGQHTEEILTGLLGYSADEVKTLKAAGVV